MTTACLMTDARPWVKARKVNQTSNGFVSKIPTATEPAGDAATATGASVYDLTNSIAGGFAQSRACVLFFGVGANNNTFSARLIGWSQITTAPGGTSVTSDKALWVPTVLIEVAVTLSSTPIGVANKIIVATELFADTITITGTTANAGVGCEVVSPANDTIGHILVDLKGAQKLEFSFTTGGSATDCNALFKLW